MKAKLKGDNIRFTAECEEDVAWIRQASRFNFLTVRQASVGAAPNYVDLHAASGFHVCELTSLLTEVSKKLNVINESFLIKKETNE